MRGTRLLPSILLATASVVNGLLFTEGSDCEAYCSEGSSKKGTATNPADIACKDNDYSGESRGIRFQKCNECLQNSNKTSGSDSDVHALVYNVRYAFDVCLYSYPDDSPAGQISTPCNINWACAGLDDALKSGLTKPSTDTTYDYCDKTKNLTDGDGYNGCMSCLRSSPDQKYLANFLTIMKAGCEQRPVKGDTLSLSGDVFSTYALNITNPADDINKKPEGAGSHTITTGAIVGITVGVALFLLGGIALLFMYFRRQRRATREKIDSPPPGTPGGTPEPKTPKFIGSSFRQTDALPVSSKPSMHKMSESIGAYKTRPDVGGHKRSQTLTTIAPYEGNWTRGLGLTYTRPYQHNVAPSEPPVPLANRNTEMPAHPAYIPKVMSRNSTREPLRGNNLVNNRPDSYALLQYLNAPEPTNPANPADQGRPIATSHSRSFSQPIQNITGPSGTTMPPPPPPPPPNHPPHARHKPKVPSLVLPSLSKAKKNKMYEPPQVVSMEQDEARQGLSISKPFAPEDGTTFVPRPMERSPEENPLWA